jgi:hypothetical protein
MGIENIVASLDAISACRYGYLLENSCRALPEAGKNRRDTAV